VEVGSDGSVNTPLAQLRREGDQLAPALASNGSDLLLAWGDFLPERMQLDVRMMFFRRGASSSMVRDTSSVISRSAPPQGEAQIVSGHAGFLSVWMEGDVVRRIRARLLDRNGEVIGDAFDIASSDADHITPAVGWNGSEYLVVWREVTVAESRMLARRISAHGALLGESDIVLDHDEFRGRAETADVSPDVSSDGSSFLVTWPRCDFFGIPRELLAARIVGDKAGEAVSLVKSPGYPIHHMYSPHALWLGTHYLVTYIENPNDPSVRGAPPDPWQPSELRVLRVDVDGRPIGASSTVVIGAAEYSAAASDGRGVVLLFNVHDLERHNGIDAVWLDQDGRVQERRLLDPFGSRPAVAWSGESYFAAWQVGDSIAAGTIPHDPGSSVERVIMSSSSSRRPSVAAIGRENIVAYERLSVGEPDGGVYRAFSKPFTSRRTRSIERP
jgi:hypothetical protein